MKYEMSVFILVYLLDLVCLKSNALNITVGYLYTTRTKTFPFFSNRAEGRLISGAITYALDRVNNDPDLLPNVTLNLVINETFGDTRYSLEALTYQWRRGAVAFFGPEETCDYEAMLASAWNLPMISYVSYFLFTQSCTDFLILKEEP